MIGAKIGGGAQIDLLDSLGDFGGLQIVVVDGAIDVVEGDGCWGRWGFGVCR